MYRNHGFVPGLRFCTTINYRGENRGIGLQPVGGKDRLEAYPTIRHASDVHFMPQISQLTVTDPRLSPYRDLPHSNLTVQSGRFVVEGKWMVERLANSPYEVESVVVDERQLAMVPKTLRDTVPIFVLPPGEVEQLIGFNFHRGILACGLRQPLQTLSALIPPRGPTMLVACLDIQDPTNLGGILRNCAAFGVDGVLLNRRCADPFSRRVLRVSMGTAFQLRLASLSDWVADLQWLRGAAECELLATVLAEDAESLETVTRAERTVLLIGNEGHGLPAECVALCQRRVTLRMQLGTDSLNAAAATAVFLYQLMRVGSSRTASGQ